MNYLKSNLWNAVCSSFLRKIYSIAAELSVFLLISISTALPLSAQKVIVPDTSNAVTLRIDPSNANGGNVSDIFESVNYIPLETISESIFGMISQLEVTQDHYIIYDEDTDCILIFNRSGKFHAKIKGKSESLGYKINSFRINKWTNQIVYSNNGCKTLIYCDFNGKVVKTIDAGLLKSNKINLSSSFFTGPDDMISYTKYFPLDTLTEKGPSSRSLITFIKGLHTVYAKAFEYGAAESKIDVSSPGIGPLTNFGNDTTFFFSKLYDYSIYTVTPGKIALSYKFIFPFSSSLPNNFLRSFNLDGGIIPYIYSHKETIFWINNCYKTGNNLLFEASVFGSYNEDNLIYNLKSGNLIAYKHILPDEHSFFLPIYDPLGISFSNTGIAACDQIYIYTSVSSLSMFIARDENKSRKIKYTPILTEYLTKGNKSDNPVILQLKLKENL